MERDDRTRAIARRAPSGLGGHRPRGFVELMARSNFSFLQGGSHPEEMVERAMLLGYDGVGLCDLNGLYGVVRGWQTVASPSHFVASVAPQKDFRYLLGAELTLTEGGSLVLMPQNKTGYGALCELLTIGKRDSPKGFSRLSLAEIGMRGGECLAFLLPPWSDELYDRAAAFFGDRLYLPVWRDFTWESLDFYARALQLERDRDAKLFVTQRAFFHDRDRKPVFDTLTCILHGVTLEDARAKLIQNGERFLRPLDELSRLWHDRPDLVERTLDIAKRVTFSLKEIRYRYPNSKLPEGRTPSEHLRALVENGLVDRFPEGIPEIARRSVEKELALIKDLQYEDYFLTLKEICEFADERGILYQGRGSAANSVVCFALRITNVDPRKIDLLFERFISKERNEPPDIDIDFEHERREEVIQHIYAKYGEAHAAMVCNVIRYRSRMAFRETAKAFGVPLPVINAAIKFMGRDGLRRLMEDREARERLGIPDEIWRPLLGVARMINGFPRHLGIHTGGFIITQDPLNECTPVEKATMEGRYVVQWNKDDVNALGLMKIDLLSLGMLTCLRKSFDLLREHKGLDTEIARLPAEDPATYEMIGEADTVGVFQIESRAQMVTLPRMKPRTFYDLVIEVALIRPGPLQGGMVHPFLRRRAGREKVEYPDERLKPILAKTEGIPLFQEQVMQIAIVGAGFTPGEADELRRLMTSSWLKPGIMEAVRDKVITGLTSNGFTAEYAAQIYRTIEGFSSYGFPESHSASFALLTYASCYLKKHHPETFTCALLNSQPMGFYAPRTLIADAQRHGVRVLDVDVNRSAWDCTLERTGDGTLALRLGLRLLRGFPKEAGEALVRERGRDDYADLTDVVRRVSLSRAHLQRLAAAGAFACFGRAPRDLLWHLESVELDRESLLFSRPRQTFAAAPAFPAALPVAAESLSPVPAESRWDVLHREYETKGLSTDFHPLSILRPWIEERNAELRSLRRVPFDDSARLKERRHKAAVRVAGLSGIVQRPPTAKGFCFITLEDENGFINVVIPPDIYQKDRVTIYTHSLLEVRGELRKVDGVLNVRATRVLPLAPSASAESLQAPTAHTGLR